MRTCEDCGGTGKRYTSCHVCGGQGRTSSEETVAVRIPPGTDNGSRLRVSGKNVEKLGGGDLVIETRIRPHPFFRREGLHLFLKLPVTLDEAYNGARIEVPTPDGMVKLRIPPRSSPGTQLRLPQKGVTRGNEHGDMYVEINVKLPDQDDPVLAEAAKSANKSYSQPVRSNLRL